MFCQLSNLFTASPCNVHHCQCVDVVVVSPEHLKVIVHLEHLRFLLHVGCDDATSWDVCLIDLRLVVGCGWMTGLCRSILIIVVVGVVILLLVKS